MNCVTKSCQLFTALTKPQQVEYLKKVLKKDDEKLNEFVNELKKKLESKGSVKNMRDFLDEHNRQSDAEEDEEGELHEL